MNSVMTARASAWTELDLDTYTDAQAMRSLLQRHLPEFANGRLRIETLAVSKARRNTSLHRNPSPMTVCYELQVCEPSRGRIGTQVLYAKVFRAGLAEAFFRQQDRSRLARPAFGQALVHVAELNMVLWALPNDPGLLQLTTLLDPTRAAAVLPWAAMGAARAEFGAVQVELLRYEPESRATLRYTLARGGGARERTLYAKTFCDDQARAIHARFEYFWRLVHVDAPLVARPLGHCAASKALWQAPATGTPLLQSLDARNGQTLVGGVARALALLHAAPLAPTAGAIPRSAAHWVSEARRRQTKIGRADAALARRAARVADAIEAHAGREAARPLSLIHGDFHPDQVWVHEGRIVLFDFDEFTLGDPMEDLATFVLKLEQAGAPAQVTAAFVEQYAARAPGRFDRHSLRWHMTIQGLLQASRAFVFQQPGWADALERRLACCEAHAATLNMESAA